MHLYVELWKTRPAWHALPPAERGAFLEPLGAAVGGLAGAGIELLGFARADADAPHSAGYPYMAVWRMPSAEHARQLEAVVEGAGWHRYFEQVNARGAVAPPSKVLGHMVGAAAGAAAAA